MTEQQKQDFFIFIQKFCSDNIGNRLNEWIIEAFLNRASKRLQALPTYADPANHASHDIGTRSGKGTYSQQEDTGKCGPD